MIAVVDYGMGNLRSVAKALERVGASVEVTPDARRIASAAGVVLPGVGAFGKCMENLRGAGLDGCVREVAKAGRPFLGICVGMQILFEESEEFGPVAGLGILPGRVKKFMPRDAAQKVPHMGWNTLDIKNRVPVLRGIADGSYAYFVHSYYVETDDPQLAATTTTYGVSFASSVARGNLFATQFHPEKSQEVGLKMLANFVESVGEPARAGA
jgi:glutamine amidotransferase